MAKLTDSLHDYLNIMSYISMTVNNKTISSCDVAYSDINCTVIKSYKDQIVEMLRAEIIIAQLEAMVEHDDGEDE